MKLKIDKISFRIDEDDSHTYGYGYLNNYRIIFHCYDEINNYQLIEFESLTADEFLENFDLLKGEFPYQGITDNETHWLTTYLKFNLTNTHIQFYAHSKPDPTKEYEESYDEEFLMSMDLKDFESKLKYFREIVKLNSYEK